MNAIDDNGNKYWDMYGKTVLISTLDGTLFTPESIEICERTIEERLCFFLSSIEKEFGVKIDRIEFTGV